MSNNRTIKKCETIDEFIYEYSIWRNPSDNSNIYENIIVYNQRYVLSILKLETNVPSEHDLSLIKMIHEVKHNFRILVNNTWDQETNEILEIYSKRKIGVIKMQRPLFETIDSLYEYCKTSTNNFQAIHLYENEYEYMLGEHSDLIIYALSSKLNKPSIHDLNLIKEINIVLSYTKHDGAIAGLTRMLQMYNSRK